MLPFRVNGSKLDRMDRQWDEERATLLALLEAKPDRMTWPAIASEVTLRGSATELWEEFYPPTLEGINDQGGRISAALKNLRAWRGTDYRLVTVLDPDYPVALREIHQLPPFLFVKGALSADENGVSVVGSRAASDRGLHIAARIAEGLVERGITVISGLAAGIDAAAHSATLNAGGRPLGVIGTGITGVYPAANRKLHADVAAAGALVSQFWPDAPPRQQHFPMRNAVMSGLGRASIVIEASEHSGARIQARVAVEHGRPVILTDLVIRATDWAKQLLGRPGVYEAGGISETMDLIEHLTAKPEIETRWPDLAEFAAL